MQLAIHIPFRICVSRWRLSLYSQPRGHEGLPGRNLSTVRELLVFIEKILIHFWDLVDSRLTLQFLEVMYAFWLFSLHDIGHLIVMFFVRVLATLSSFQSMVIMFIMVLGNNREVIEVLNTRNGTRDAADELCICSLFADDGHLCLGFLLLLLLVDGDGFHSNFRVLTSSWNREEMPWSLQLDLRHFEALALVPSRELFTIC